MLWLRIVAMLSTVSLFILPLRVVLLYASTLSYNNLFYGAAKKSCEGYRRQSKWQGMRKHKL